MVLPRFLALEMKPGEDPGFGATQPVEPLKDIVRAEIGIVSQASRTIPKRMPAVGIYPPAGLRRGGPCPGSTPSAEIRSAGQ
jgi:hypothetical protein